MYFVFVVFSFDVFLKEKIENKKERKTGLGPATPTLARLCSTN